MPTVQRSRTTKRNRRDTPHVARDLDLPESVNPVGREQNVSKLLWSDGISFELHSLGKSGTPPSFIIPACGTNATRKSVEFGM